MEVKPVEVSLKTSGWFPTKGLFFEPANDDPSKPVVLLFGATGCPAKFYSPFASFLASTHSTPVFLLDPRFLGISFPPEVDLSSLESKRSALAKYAKDVKITNEWLEDLRAAFAWLIEKYRIRDTKEGEFLTREDLGKQIVYVGHSVGGWLLPLVTPYRSLPVRALYMSCFNPAYDGYGDMMPLREEQDGMMRQKTEELGYYPSTIIRMGEDIPSACGLEWLHWMQFVDYKASIYPEQFATFPSPTLTPPTDPTETYPILTVHTADDPLASLHLSMKASRPYSYKPSSRPHQLRPEDRADSKIIHLTLDPPSLGWTTCGHVDIFKSRHSPKARSTFNAASADKTPTPWEVLAEWIVFERLFEGVGVRRRKEDWAWMIGEDGGPVKGVGRATETEDVVGEEEVKAGYEGAAKAKL